MVTSPKKILVTGVAGFLGSHLAEKLSRMNHKVVGVDNMMGGYKDNVPKDIDFFDFDCLIKWFKQSNNNKCPFCFKSINLYKIYIKL